MDSSLLDKLILVGAVTGGHGLRGQVKIKSFTADVSDLTAYGSLLLADGTIAPKLSITGQAKGLLIASIEGISSREQAEVLKQTQFFIPRHQLPDHERDNEFYIEDLKGLRVVDEQGTAIGTVRDVANYGAGDIVDITFTDGPSRSFSFTQRTFPSINIATGQLTLHAPDEITASGNDVDGTNEQ